MFSLTQTCNNLLTLTPPEPAVDNLHFLKNVGSLNEGNKLHPFHSVQHFFFTWKATSPTAHFSLIDTSESLPGRYANLARVAVTRSAVIGRLLRSPFLVSRSIKVRQKENRLLGGVRRDAHRGASETTEVVAA